MSIKQVSENKQAILKNVARSTGDTGSVQVQIVELTERIRQLSAHLSKFKKDFSSKSGLLKMISQRRTFMKYVERKDQKSYRLLCDYIEELKK